MRKFIALASVAGILTAGGTALAKEKAAEPAGAVKEKKICKGDTDSTSRIAKKRVCKTKAEWAGTSSQGEVDDAERKLRGMSRD